MRSTVTHLVARAQQKGGTGFAIHSTLHTDTTSYEILIMLDLTDAWVPFHRHLYARTRPPPYRDRLNDCGKSIEEFSDSWNWATDLRRIFVPQQPGPLITIHSLAVGSTPLEFDQTKPSTWEPVTSFDHEQYRRRSTSDFMIVVRLGMHTSDGLTYGVFQNEYQSDPNQPTLFVTDGASPPNQKDLAHQVQQNMHIDMVVRPEVTYRRGSDQPLAEESGVHSIAFRIPLNGTDNEASVLPSLGTKIGRPVAPAETFERHFDRIAEMPGVFKGIEVDDTIGILEEMKKSMNQKSITVLGVDFPLTLFTHWGQALMLVALIYFTVHLHELKRRLESHSDDRAWTSAWIALYGSLGSRCVTICSLVFPVVVSIVALSIVRSTGTSRDLSVSLLMASCIVGLALSTAIILHRLVCMKHGPEI